MTGNLELPEDGEVIGEQNNNGNIPPPFDPDPDAAQALIYDPVNHRVATCVLPFRPNPGGKLRPILYHTDESAANPRGYEDPNDEALTNAMDGLQIFNATGNNRPRAGVRIIERRDRAGGPNRRVGVISLVSPDLSPADCDIILDRILTDNPTGGTIPRLYKHAEPIT